MTAATERPWAEIARRAQETTGRDRILDTDAWWHALPDDHKKVLDGSRYHAMFWVGGTDPAFGETSRVEADAPRITASVDAMLALIAENLPGWTRYVEELREGRWFGGVRNPEDTERGRGYRGDRSAYAATPALALLAAFALAMDAQPLHADEGGKR